MQAKLIVVAGRANRQEIPLKLPLSIGRGHDQRLAILHPMVSRRHCELFERNGLLWVRDLGSANGTLLGDQRVTESVVKPGERLTIGPLVFEAVYELSNGELSNGKATTPVSSIQAMPVAPSTAVEPLGESTVRDIDLLSATDLDALDMVADLESAPAMPVPPATANVTPPIAAIDESEFELQLDDLAPNIDADSLLDMPPSESAAEPFQAAGAAGRDTIEDSIDNEDLSLADDLDLSSSFDMASDVGLANDIKPVDELGMSAAELDLGADLAVESHAVPAVGVDSFDDDAMLLLDLLDDGGEIEFASLEVAQDPIASVPPGSEVMDNIHAIADAPPAEPMVAFPLDSIEPDELLLVDDFDSLADLGLIESKPDEAAALDVEATMANAESSIVESTPSSLDGESDWLLDLGVVDDEVPSAIPVAAEALSPRSPDVTSPGDLLDAIDDSVLPLVDESDDLRMPFPEVERAELAGPASFETPLEPVADDLSFDELCPLTTNEINAPEVDHPHASLAPVGVDEMDEDLKPLDLDDAALGLDELAFADSAPVSPDHDPTEDTDFLMLVSDALGDDPDVSTGQLAAQSEIPVTEESMLLFPSEGSASEGDFPSATAEPGLEPLGFDTEEKPSDFDLLDELDLNVGPEPWSPPAPVDSVPRSVVSQDDMETPGDFDLLDEDEIAVAPQAMLAPELPVAVDTSAELDLGLAPEPTPNSSPESLDEFGLNAGEELTGFDSLGDSLLGDEPPFDLDDALGLPSEPLAVEAEDIAVIQSNVEEPDLLAFPSEAVSALEEPALLDLPGEDQPLPGLDLDAELMATGGLGLESLSDVSPVDKAPADDINQQRLELDSLAEMESLDELEPLSDLLALDSSEPASVQFDLDNDAGSLIDEPELAATGAELDELEPLASLDADEYLTLDLNEPTTDSPGAATAIPEVGETDLIAWDETPSDHENSKPTLPPAQPIADLMPDEETELAALDGSDDLIEFAGFELDDSGSATLVADDNGAMIHAESAPDATDESQAASLLSETAEPVAKSKRSLFGFLSRSKTSKIPAASNPKAAAEPVVELELTELVSTAESTAESAVETPAPANGEKARRSWFSLGKKGPSKSTAAKPEKPGKKISHQGEPPAATSPVGPTETFDEEILFDSDSEELPADETQPSLPAHHFELKAAASPKNEPKPAQASSANAPPPSADGGFTDDELDDFFKDF